VSFRCSRRNGPWRRHEADVAGREIERAGLARRREHAHARLAFDVVLPLVGIRMPVQLAHSTQLDLDERGRTRGETDPAASAAAAADPRRVIGESKSRFPAFIDAHGRLA
jgi:hypothetical protein